MIPLTSLAAAALASTSTPASAMVPPEPASAAVVARPSLENTARRSQARRYAVVIGVNEPARPEQRPLRFADDDAVRFYEVFREIAVDVELFSLLDDETQRLYPAVVPQAALPEKEQLFARIDRIFERIRADRSRGEPTEFYLVYSGHGYVDEGGEGRLSLHGSTFSRTELYERVLAASPATVNHLIIDACDAYFFVQARGRESDVEALLDQRARRFLDRQTLGRHPNTGAILSTASAAETHEWSAIRAGVFSHEVRSALLGAADADASGTVSYQELESFVRSANAKVAHARADRAIFVQPPRRDRLHPVIDLDGMPRAHRLHLPSDVGGRIAVADDRGRRYADLNKAPGFAMALRLLPGVRYIVRLAGSEFRVPGDAPDVDLGRLTALPPSTVARGVGIADAYAKGLFAVPFGPQLVEGFELGLSRHPPTVLAEPGPELLGTTAWVVTGAAAIAGGLAAGFYAAGGAAHTDYLGATDVTELEGLASTVRAWDARASVAMGAAVSLGVTAAVLFVIDALGDED